MSNKFVLIILFENFLWDHGWSTSKFLWVIKFSLSLSQFGGTVMPKYYILMGNIVLTNIFFHLIYKSNKNS